MIDRDSLNRAEKELRSALAANQARKTSQVFGYETYATLRGDEVEALVGELDRLRGVEFGVRTNEGTVGEDGAGHRGQAILSDQELDREVAR